MLRLWVEAGHLILNKGLLLRIIVKLRIGVVHINTLLILPLILCIERTLIHLRSHKSHLVIHLGLHERILNELVLAAMIYRRLLLNLNSFIKLAVSRILRLSSILLI